MKKKKNNKSSEACNSSAALRAVWRIATCLATVDSYRDTVAGAISKGSSNKFPGTRGSFQTRTVKGSSHTLGSVGSYTMCSVDTLGHSSCMGFGEMLGKKLCQDP